MAQKYKLLYFTLNIPDFPRLHTENSLRRRGIVCERKDFRCEGEGIDCAAKECHCEGQISSEEARNFSVKAMKVTAKARYI